MLANFYIRSILNAQGKAREEVEATPSVSDDTTPDATGTNELPVIATAGTASNTVAATP